MNKLSVKNGALTRPSHSITPDEHTRRKNHNCENPSISTSHTLDFIEQLTLPNLRIRRRVLDRPRNGKREQPCALPTAAKDKWQPASIALHDVQAAKRANEVHRSEDDLGDVRVGEADGLEDRCAVVEELTYGRLESVDECMKI